jgi:glucokinase
MSPSVGDSVDRLLVGDIGGTNARFAIRGVDGCLHHAHTLQSSSFASMADALRAYQAVVPDGTLPVHAALGIAGPTDGLTASLTNCPMRVDADEAKTVLGMESFVLFNDFTAIARSLSEFGADDVLPIGPRLSRTGSKAVVGPGTGLGVAALATTHLGWDVVASEGGHIPIAAHTADERETLRTLSANSGFISAEMLFSGGGLERLHRTILYMEGLPSVELTAREITHRAWGKTDASCQHAVDLFYGFLGVAASSAALNFCAIGGVYVAGGIVRRNPEALVASRFRENFEHHPTMTHFLQSVPTYLVLHPSPGLVGVAGLFDDLMRGSL